MKQLHVSPHDIHDMKVRNFSEDELLKLQELFITYGFHAVSVDSFAKGRALLEVFLATHARYHQCAVLSDVPMQAAYDVLQMYRDESFVQAVERPEKLDDYLLNTLYVDFLVIECTPYVLKQRWYPRLEQLIKDLNFSNACTIVKIMYA